MIKKIFRISLEFQMLLNKTKNIVNLQSKVITIHQNLPKKEARSLNASETKKSNFCFSKPKTKFHKILIKFQLVKI